jgi:hypothetical protein
MAISDEEQTANADEVFKNFDRCEAPDEKARSLRRWAVSLFCWDGLLPLAVIGWPNLLKLLWPNWELGLALAGIGLPVIALSIRFVMGWVRLRGNQSYVWQTVIFTIGISALFLFEAFLLNDQIAKGPKIAHPTTLITMFLVYFAAMSIALFPLRNPGMPIVHSTTDDVRFRNQ